MKNVQWHWCASKNGGWTIPIKLYQGSFSLSCYLGAFINRQAKANFQFRRTYMRQYPSQLVHCNWFYMNPESVIFGPRISKCFGVWPGAILESNLNGNKLTLIPGFWCNTQVRKGYSSQNSRTWSWKGDINDWHSKGAYWTIFSLLSLGILETNTG